MGESHKMKISELIMQLEYLKKCHGDLDIFMEFPEEQPIGSRLIAFPSVKSANYFTTRHLVTNKIFKGVLINWRKKYED